MTSFRSGLKREDLARYFGKDMRVIRAFEEQAAQVETTAQAAVAATNAIEDASVITLSANEAFRNERVLRVDSEGLSLTSDGNSVTISAKIRNPTTYRVSLAPIGDTTLILPLSGTLVTREAEQVLINKTLDKPKAVLLNAPDDAAAATAGVPVGGLYNASGAVRIRLT